MGEVSERIYFVLTTILIIAAGTGIVASFFSQPLIVAYIASGALIGILSANVVAIPTPVETFGFFSQIGIALILFMVGIELSIDDLKSVGKSVFSATFFHGAVIGISAFLLALVFKFNTISSLYIALAVTFSSTVIVVKLLDDQRDINSLYGKLTIGVLLLQDLVAVVILMILAGLGPKGKPFDIGLLGFTFFKGVVLIVGFGLLSKYLLKKVFSYVAQNQELLFLCTLAWALGVSSLWRVAGFSFEIGAFLAGISLASLPFRYAISARIAPIRDFFIIIFFIVLGLTIDFGAVRTSLLPIIVFSIFVLVFTPIVVVNYLGYLGFGKRVSFLSGIALSQVSEFSLILVVVGRNLGHLDQSVVSFISSVAIFTIAVSSYLILNGSKIYRFIGPKLKILERKKTISAGEVTKKEFENHTVLVGCEQMGNDILNFLKSKNDDLDKIVVVDFNPEIISSLQASGTNVVFGDISDPETLDQLNLSTARLLITTIPDLIDNIHLIKFAKSKGFHGPVVAAAYWVHDAIRMYEAGADYVVVPETVGGKHISRYLAENWEHLGQIKKAKSKHFEELISRKVF